MVEKAQIYTRTPTPYIESTKGADAQVCVRVQLERGESRGPALLRWAASLWDQHCAH